MDYSGIAPLIGELCGFIFIFCYKYLPWIALALFGFYLLYFYDHLSILSSLLKKFEKTSNFWNSIGATIFTLMIIMGMMIMFGGGYLLSFEGESPSDENYANNFSYYITVIPSSELNLSGSNNFSSPMYFEIVNMTTPKEDPISKNSSLYGLIALGLAITSIGYTVLKDFMEENEPKKE